MLAPIFNVSELHNLQILLLLSIPLCTDQIFYHGYSNYTGFGEGKGGMSCGMACGMACGMT